MTRHDMAVILGLGALWSQREFAATVTDRLLSLTQRHDEPVAHLCTAGLRFRDPLIHAHFCHERGTLCHRVKQPQIIMRKPRRATAITCDACLMRAARTCVDEMMTRIRDRNARPSQESPPPQHPNDR